MNVQDWLYFVAQHLTNEQVAALSQADSLARRKYVLSKISAPRLFVGHGKRPTSSLAERLKSLIKEAPDFWRNHLGEHDPPKEQGKLRLLLDGSYSSHAPGDLRRLGIFFD